MTPEAIERCYAQEVVLRLPKLGDVVVACTNCPLDEDYAYSSTLKQYLIGMNWRAEASYKMKGARVWKSPTTQNWYITLSFQRFDDIEFRPPPGTPIRGEVLWPDADIIPYLDEAGGSIAVALLHVIRETFETTQAKALTAKELIEALARKGITINDKVLAMVLRHSPKTNRRTIASRKTKRGGRVLWCYHREDFVEAWEHADATLRRQQEQEEYQRWVKLEQEAHQQRLREQEEFLKQWDAWEAEQEARERDEEMKFWEERRARTWQRLSQQVSAEDLEILRERGWGP